MRSSHASSTRTSSARAEPAWFALHTRARSERKVVRALERRDIRCFFPVVRRKRRWHDRNKLLSCPLFPGYVFARVDAGALPALARIDGVADFVRFGERPALIHDDEIDNMLRFAGALNEKGGEASRVQYTDGARVRIAAGPWSGLEGVVVDAGEPARVIIGIPTIGMGFEVEVFRKSLTVS